MVNLYLYLRGGIMWNVLPEAIYLSHKENFQVCFFIDLDLFYYYATV